MRTWLGRRLKDLPLPGRYLLQAVPQLALEAHVVGGHIVALHPGALLLVLHMGGLVLHLLGLVVLLLLVMVVVCPLLAILLRLLGLLHVMAVLPHAAIGHHLGTGSGHAALVPVALGWRRGSRGHRTGPAGQAAVVHLVHAPGVVVLLHRLAHLPHLVAHLGHLVAHLAHLIHLAHGGHGLQVRNDCVHARSIDGAHRVAQVHGHHRHAAQRSNSPDRQLGHRGHGRHAQRHARHARHRVGGHLLRRRHSGHLQVHRGRVQGLHGLALARVHGHGRVLGHVLHLAVKINETRHQPPSTLTFPSAYMP